MTCESFKIVSGWAKTTIMFLSCGMTIQLTLINLMFNNPTTSPSDRLLSGQISPSTVLLQFHISIMQQFTFRHWHWFVGTNLQKSIWPFSKYCEPLHTNIKYYVYFISPRKHTNWVNTHSIKNIIDYDVLNSLIWYLHLSDILPLEWIRSD